MRIISRSEWGARYGDGAGPAQTPASEVWLHHTVTVAPDMAEPWDDDYAAMRRLDEIGADSFGEQYGVPYTFVITPVGLIFEGHAVAQQGAHTKGHNTVGRAIAWVGNYENRQPTQQQIEATAWLLQHGHAQGWWIQPRLTGGHRDVYATACPGIHAYNTIPEINRLAASGAIEEDELDMDRATFEQQVHNGVLQALHNPDVRGEILRAVWHDATVSRSGNDIPALQELADAKTKALEAVAQAAGLTAAVQKLADQTGVTTEQIAEIVRDAVRQSIEITGTVEVSGSQEAS